MMESWQRKYLVLENELVLKIFNDERSVDEALKLCDRIAFVVAEAILRIGYGEQV